MIDYKFIRKKFSNKLLLFFLIVSLIPSIFIVFYNSNKVYQFKINLKKIEVINNFGLEPNNFIEKITDNSNILIKPINNYTKFIPENFHTLNNNNLYIYLRKKDILDYYLDIVTKIDLDPRDIIIFLKKKTDKEIHDHYVKQYQELLMILNDEEIIKNYTYSFDRVLLKLGEYELVCLNKKLPFQNNFNINFKDFNKVFYNLKTNIDIFNFIHNLQDLVLSNKLDSCIDKTFFKEKIVNLEINIKKNFEENVKLLKDILLKKINKINQFTNIYSFSFLQSKDNKFYDVIDFFKYFSFFFFLLIIQRIILSKIFK